ncbi:MAG: hypothetical protein CMJ74_12845 [Planctomycetaceae bacterium]|nr:hypothetical protein [Planctomycetaceae bacterium]|tara:strand:- start:3969 stop:4823 length:855 start_codon:yes stop_codon:yes gene_type:complete
MRFLTFICCLMATSVGHAAWYQKTDGVIVDPILDTAGAILSYTGPNLQPGAMLDGEDLSSADLVDADLEGSAMSNINLSGTKMWRSDFRQANLTNGDLSGAFLFRSDLRGADMSGAVLPSADFQEVNLEGATLNSSNFQDVKLWYSNMRDTHIRNSDFSGAKLGNADLLGSDLTDTNLASAKVYRTVFHYANISGTDLTNLEFYADAEWANAFYYTDNEPIWGANMDPTFRASAGIVALSPGSSPLYPVPEPGTNLLILIACFGFAGLMQRLSRCSSKSLRKCL